MANDKNGGGAHEDYLNAPDTAGRPMAIGSLIMVFLVIAAVALALFVGGRWFYNEVVKGDDSSQVATGSDGESSDGANSDSESGSSSDTQSDSDSSNGDSGNSADSDGSGTDNSGSTSDGSTSDEGNTSSESESSSSDTNGTATSDSSDSTGTGSSSSSNASGEQDAATSAVTGPSTEEVPTTGPESLLAIFIGATIIGSIAHRKWLVNRL